MTASEMLEALAMTLEDRIEEIVAANSKEIKARRFARGPFNDRTLRDRCTQAETLISVVKAVRAVLNSAKDSAP